jgi:drug/metabolite transporter (DMT)-like permease
MKPKAAKFWDWVLLLTCNLIWASQFVVVKLVQAEMGPLFAVTFPIALSTVLLAVLVARERKGRGCAPPDSKATH